MGWTGRAVAYETIGQTRAETTETTDGQEEGCRACKNFDPDKKGGYCRKRDKKRSADDKAGGHFDPRS